MIVTPGSGSGQYCWTGTVIVTAGLSERAHESEHRTEQAQRGVEGRDDERQVHDGRRDPPRPVALRARANKKIADRDRHADQQPAG